MLIVTTQGAPFDRGQQYGRQLAAQVRRRAPAAALLTGGVPRGFQPGEASRANQVASAMLHYLSAHEPGLVEEMRGLAAGAEVPFEAVFHLNAGTFVRYVLDFSGAGAYRYAEPGTPKAPGAAPLPRDPQGGCTNVAFGQTEVGPLLGKTNDGGAPVPPDRQPETWVLQHAHPEGGAPFFMFAPAGMLAGVAGMNAHGLAVGQSATQVVPDQDGDGVPSNLMLRPLVERCATVQDALGLLGARRMAGKGLNLMLLDAAGTVRAAEQSGSLLGVRSPDAAGTLYFSNHSHTPDLRDLPPRHDRANSLRRWRWLSETLDGPAVPHTREGMLQVISSHGADGVGDGDGAICQHGPDMFTSLGLLIAPRQRTLWAADGPPCGAPFQERRLD